MSAPRSVNISLRPKRVPAKNSFLGWSWLFHRCRRQRAMVAAKLATMKQRARNDLSGKCRQPRSASKSSLNRSRTSGGSATADAIPSVRVSLARLASRDASTEAKEFTLHRHRCTCHRCGVRGPNSA